MDDEVLPKTKSTLENKNLPIGEQILSFKSYHLLRKWQNGDDCVVSAESKPIYISTVRHENYRKNSKIWDTSNNCHNCPKNRKV